MAGAAKRAIAGKLHGRRPSLAYVLFPADGSGRMTTKIIPSGDVLAAHEQAAARITELRRKGIPCHLEENTDRSGCHIDVVEDQKMAIDAPRPPRRMMRGRRSS